MQVRLGEKIREYRKSAGIRQEDLASALGVTSQAVSRWEAVGGYPDIEMIPAIANYFHITIDELFGYESDREKYISKICTKADELLDAQGDMTECITMLREALSEFPGENKFTVRLGYALYHMGWKKYGLQLMTESGNDYMFGNVDYHAKNEYWQESVIYLRHALDHDLDPDYRLTTLILLIELYKWLGMSDKAVELSNRQDPIEISRELLLSRATDGKTAAKYHGEAILVLMKALSSEIKEAAWTIIPMWHDGSGVRTLTAAANLYECLFGYSDCGFHHAHIRDIYMDVAYLESLCGDMSRAMEYFDKCFEHHKKYEAAVGHGVRGYDVPLFGDLTYDSDAFSADVHYWRQKRNAFNENMQNAIRANPKYAECFSE